MPSQCSRKTCKATQIKWSNTIFVENAASPVENVLPHVTAELRVGVTCNWIHANAAAGYPSPHMGQIARRPQAPLLLPEPRQQKSAAAPPRGHTARWEATDSTADCLSVSCDLDPTPIHPSLLLVSEVKGSLRHQSVRLFPRGVFSRV